MSDALEQAKRAADALALKTAAATAGPGEPAPLPASGGGGVDQPAVDRAEAESWAGLPAMFGSILCLALPDLKAAYSEKNCMAWGEAMVPLARKHGWSFAKLGPELGVAAASVPMLVPTVSAIIKARRAPVAGGAAAPGGAGSLPAAAGDASSSEAAAIAEARRRAEARRDASSPAAPSSVT